MPQARARFKDSPQITLPTAVYSWPFCEMLEKPGGEMRLDLAPASQPSFHNPKWGKGGRGRCSCKTDSIPSFLSDHPPNISWLGLSHSHLPLDLEQTSHLESGIHKWIPVRADQWAKESGIWSIFLLLELFRLWALVTKASWL